MFQSDNDFDIISELGYDLGLASLEEAAQANAKAAGKDQEEIDGVYYTIYGPSCSDPEIVRKHLDSGVLTDIIAEKEAMLLSIPSGTKEQQLEYYFRDPCYIYVLLGACAMTLGCQLPDAYIAMLRKVFTEGGFMSDALEQMKKALFGPHPYKNGVPYDFESMDLIETANSQSAKDDESNSMGFIGMNVMSPGGLFDTGMGNSDTSIIIKELREKHNNPGTCGNCHAKNGEDGKDLLMCSRCKDRKYCSTECQVKHWKKVHKKLCEPARAS